MANWVVCSWTAEVWKLNLLATRDYVTIPMSFASFELHLESNYGMYCLPWRLASRSSWTFGRINIDIISWLQFILQVFNPIAIAISIISCYQRFKINGFQPTIQLIRLPFNLMIITYDITTRVRWNNKIIPRRLRQHPRYCRLGSIDMTVVV